MRFAIVGSSNALDVFAGCPHRSGIKLLVVGYRPVSANSAFLITFLSKLPTPSCSPLKVAVGGYTAVAPSSSYFRTTLESYLVLNRFLNWVGAPSVISISFLNCTFSRKSLNTLSLHCL
jgi:hypothetical protein